MKFATGTEYKSDMLSLEPTCLPLTPGTTYLSLHASDKLTNHLVADFEGPTLLIPKPTTKPTLVPIQPGSHQHNLLSQD